MQQSKKTRCEWASHDYPQRSIFWLRRGDYVQLHHENKSAKVVLDGRTPKSRKKVVLRDRPEENAPAHEPGHLEEWYDKEVRTNEGRSMRAARSHRLATCSLCGLRRSASTNTPLPIRVTRPYAIAGATSRPASELTTRTNPKGFIASDPGRASQSWWAMAAAAQMVGLAH